MWVGLILFFLTGTCSFNPLDFSVILAWLPPQSSTTFRLCRYNGKSHEHTNALEGNRFYDFHVTKSRALSRLHDPSRNPGGLDACRTVCEQKYFCEDREIGRHTVTRDFRKGVFDGQQVTLVTVGKT